MIYVMGTARDGVVKIGTAVDPLSRLKQIQAGHPDPLELLLTLPGDRSVESALHARFKERRVSVREWFDFDGDDAVTAVVAAWNGLRKPVAQLGFEDEGALSGLPWEESVYGELDLRRSSAVASAPTEPEIPLTCAPVRIKHYPGEDEDGRGLGPNSRGSGVPTWAADCAAHPWSKRLLGGAADDPPSEDEWQECTGGADRSSRVPRSVGVYPFYYFPLDGREPYLTSDWIKLPNGHFCTTRALPGLGGTIKSATRYFDLKDRDR